MKRTTSGIPQPWKGIIHNSIKSNLNAFGYTYGKAETDNATEDTAKYFTDSFGHKIENTVLAVNSKGHYELSAIIDGHR